MTCWCLLWRRKLRQTSRKLCGEFAWGKAAHEKTAFDMCLNITSGRPRWSQWEEEECHEVRAPFCKCGSGGRGCGPLLLWVQLEESAWRPGDFNFAARCGENGAENWASCVISVCWLGSLVFLVLRSLRGEILIWMGLPDYIKILKKK